MQVFDHKRLVVVGIAILEAEQAGRPVPVAMREELARQLEMALRTGQTRRTLADYLRQPGAPHQNWTSALVRMLDQDLADVILRMAELEAGAEAIRDRSGRWMNGGITTMLGSAGGGIVVYVGGVTAATLIGPVLAAGAGVGAVTYLVANRNQREAVKIKAEAARNRDSAAELRKLLESPT